MDFSYDQNNRQLILNTLILNTFTNLVLRDFFNDEYNDFIINIAKFKYDRPKEPKTFNFKFDVRSYVLLENEFLKNIRLLIIEKLNLSNPKYSKHKKMEEF